MDLIRRTTGSICGNDHKARCFIAMGCARQAKNTNTMMQRLPEQVRGGRLYRSKEYAQMSICSRATLKLALLIALIVTFSICSGAFAYERTLAGLQLGRPALTCLHKYGDPSRISVGIVSLSTTVQAPMQMAPTQQSYNPYGGGQVAPFNPFGEDFAAPQGSALPQLPGIGGPPGSPAMVPGTLQTATITQQEVTWTYDLAGGVTLEVIVSEGGLITQITVGGAATWKASRTSLGIQLNSTYKDILYRYGYPEAHTQAGRFLRVSYVDKHRCMFTLLSKKVVGITIALAE